MSFLKRIFGAKKSEPPQPEQVIEQSNETHKTKHELPRTRITSYLYCVEAGYTPAKHLPTELHRQLRPDIEIAKRLNTIKALVLWLMVPEEDLPSQQILDFISNNNLEDFITEQEKTILNSSRDNETLRNAIGWKFENAWPLAWYFGYTEPEISGQMMTGEQMRDILINHSCPLDTTIEFWISERTIISNEELLQKEDLFYCIHNAVRSAQLGASTVPENFHPITNGGVIHERRHALTWMLSKGVAWDDTDLST